MIDAEHSDEKAFWEDVYFDAVEDRTQFLEKFEHHSRTYPQTKVLGKGGVKTVHLSHDWKTNRDIALACPNGSSDDDHSLEFIHEAMILGQLEHPHIIPVYDTGMDEERIPYFTMKLIKGENLRLYISRKLELPEILDIFKKVCLAVSYAHSKDIVHLDIKPENILIGEFGELFLCDWGMAEKTKELQRDIRDSRLKGTPGFIAPERIETEPADKRMDIYSLGCLLYFTLCNKAPISAENLEAYVQKLSECEIPSLEKDSPISVPQSIAQIFSKCCQHDPDQRYQQVNEIIEDLDLYTSGFATKAEEAGLLRNLQLLYKRNFVKINIILFFTFVLSFVTAYYVITLQESTRVAISEKEKAQDITKQLIEKQEKDKKFIRKTMDTVVSTFAKGRSDSTRRFLENSLVIDPDNEEAMFNLAKVRLVAGRWKRATNLLEKVKTVKQREVKALKGLIEKYEYMPESIESKYALSADALELRLQDIYFNVSDDLLRALPDLSQQVDFVQRYLKLDNGLNELKFSYKAWIQLTNATFSSLVNC